MKLFALTALLISFLAVCITFSNSPYGHKYYVYNHDLISNEYKIVKKNGGDERALKHVFNRKLKITGIRSLVISVFNIDGYKVYSTDYDKFKKELNLLNS